MLGHDPRRFHSRQTRMLHLQSQRGILGSGGCAALIFAALSVLDDQQHDPPTPFRVQVVEPSFKTSLYA